MTTKDILEAAPVQWPAIATATDLGHLQKLVRQLEAMAESAAIAAAYLEYRKANGNGDQGHPAALKHANKVYRQVRKAMGYHTTHDLSFDA